ncbi:MAG: phosphatase PAP2-related protein [Ignavibacteria bacterium]|jgi:hypothetical protein
MTWKEIFLKKRTELAMTISVLVILLIIFPRFLIFIESRNAFNLPDPILSLFTPIDLTGLIFSFIYICLVVGIIHFATNPDKLLIALQAYSVMLVFRMMVMYVTPLDAPETLLPLNDPFVQLFGSGDILTKDLFFSGHTATLFLLFLITEKTYLKIIFLICTISVGISVLLQHVHYTVDVISAPFFAYASYRIVLVIKEKNLKFLQ